MNFPRDIYFRSRSSNNDDNNKSNILPIFLLKDGVLSIRFVNNSGDRMQQIYPMNEFSTGYIFDRDPQNDDNDIVRHSITHVGCNTRATSKSSILPLKDGVLLIRFANKSGDRIE